MRCLLLLSLLLLLPASSGVRAATYVIESSQSRVRFEIGHYDYAKPVRGRFARVAGEIEVEDREPDGDSFPLIEALAVDVVIDAASVETDNRFRDSHLRISFFEAEKFPRIRFTAGNRGFTGTGLRTDKQRTVGGSLTMKGITRPIEVVVEGVREFIDSEGRRVLRCRVHARINRREFGVEENPERTSGLAHLLARIQAGLDEFIEDDVDIAITVLARER